MRRGSTAMKSPADFGARATFRSVDETSSFGPRKMAQGTANDRDVNGAADDRELAGSSPALTRLGVT